MNGFKFTDVSTLAVMVLVTMAFCGNAGQYLAMAAALVWMFAKALSLYRPRKESAPAQPKQRPAAAPATRTPSKTEPVVIPFPSPQQPKPAAAAQTVKPGTPAPDLEMRTVMQRHINCRITEQLQGAFPDATWRWETADPLAMAVKGGAARVRVFDAGDWNGADVCFDKAGRIRLEMLKLQSLEQATPPKKASGTTDPEKDSINLRSWYDLSASAIVRATIDEVHTRGYRKLNIAEDGELYVEEQGNPVKQGRLQHLPGKDLWDDLVPLFAEDDITAEANDDHIVLTWAS